MSTTTETETTAKSAAASAPSINTSSTIIDLSSNSSTKPTAASTSTLSAGPSPSAAAATTKSSRSNKQYDFGSSSSYRPEDKIQYLVQTPYGRGLTIRTWEDDKEGDSEKVRMREIELLDWTTAVTATASSSSSNNSAVTRGPVRPATLFSPQSFPSVEPKIGDDVVCLYGRGRVEAMRGADQQHKQVVVRLSSWRLAGRCTVTCILAKDAVQVVRTKKLYEMDTYERVEQAQALKSQASAQFSKKDYATALSTYTRAVESLRYINDYKTRSMAVEFRADLVLVLITCNNNAATCAWQLCSNASNSGSSNGSATSSSSQQSSSLQYAEKTLKYARDAMVLLDALEENKGMRIHQQIVAKDKVYSDIKLFGEFKVKSYIHQARALMTLHENEKALECLKHAHDIIARYTTTTTTSNNNDSTNNHSASSIKNLHASSRDVKKLYNTCRERRLKEKAKEKQRAQAMFATGSSSTSEEKKEIGRKFSSLSIPVALPSSAPLEVKDFKSET